MAGRSTRPSRVFVKAAFLEGRACGPTCHPGPDAAKRSEDGRATIVFRLARWRDPGTTSKADELKRFTRRRGGFPLHHEFRVCPVRSRFAAPHRIAILSIRGGLMPMTREFVIDFVARGNLPNEWKLVLVEQGPWADPAHEMQRLQDRLYNCIDAVLDGQIAEKFPETKKERIIIQVDCYGVPEAEVAAFFARFSEGVFQITDYCEALKRSEQTSGIGFSINFERFN
jgi:hypothetical protein